MSRVVTRVRTQTQTKQNQNENPDDIPKCTGHNRRAKQFVAGPTAKNPGRAFYACPLSRDDPGRCKFFKWVDETESQSDSTSTGGQRLGAGTTVGGQRLATPAGGQRLGGRQLQTPPRTNEIDWSMVDTDRLERDASTPHSSQQAQHTPVNERLQSAKRKSEESQTTPVKRVQLDPESPFVTSPIHPALSPSTHHLEEISEHLHRQDRLIHAGNVAKEGFRSQISKLKQRNEELEVRVKQLEAELAAARG